MTDKWRLLKIDFTSYMDFRNSLNLGILRARKEDLVPDTVVILRTLKSSMCASYYPDIEKDADVDFLGKRGVQIKRFYGGAGIGLIGRGMLVSPFYVSVKGGKVPSKHGELLSKTLGGIARELSRDFHVDCHFRAPNDVLIGERKFCLSSATFDDHVANFNIDIQIKEPEIDIISKGLPLPPEKMADKKATSHEEWITWLEKEAGRSISLEETSRSVMKALEETYDIELYDSQLTEVEYQYAQEIFNFYDSDAWQFARTERRRFGRIGNHVKRSEFRIKVPGGPFLRAVVLKEKNKIKDILITGAIQCWPIETIDHLENQIRGIPIDEKIISEKVQSIFDQPEVKIMGASAEDFVRLIQSAATQ